jgi:hypothetical protein
MRNCSHLVDNIEIRSHFFEEAESSGNFESKYKYKWRCPDPSEVWLMGNWNSVEAREISIHV